MKLNRRATAFRLHQLEKVEHMQQKKHPNAAIAVCSTSSPGANGKELLAKLQRSG